MKKWIIVGVTIAVLWSLAGVVAYMSLRHKSSQLEMVASMGQLPGGGSPWGAEWSPDGQTILYASSGIRIVDADGMNERYLGEGSEGSCPTWSPDGSKIAFESDNGLEVMNADGSGKRLLASLAEIVPPLSALRVLNPITWSPDGSMIAFELQADFPDPSLGQPNTLLAQIWTVNADGSNLKRLTTDSALEFVPSWSPDSQTIAFVSDRNDGISEIWTLHVDGSDLRQLTEGWGPRWSPDGAKIAFFSGGDIWVMDADGGNPTRVAAGSETYDHPTWSPDGAMIAFDSFRLGPLRDIWIVNADGSGKTRLTQSSTTWFTCKEKAIWFQEPRWSPDGTKLLFQGWREEGDTVFSSRLWVIELKQESSD